MLRRHAADAGWLGDRLLLRGRRRKVTLYPMGFRNPQVLLNVAEAQRKRPLSAVSERAGRLVADAWRSWRQLR